MAAMGWRDPAGIWQFLGRDRPVQRQHLDVGYPRLTAWELPIRKPPTRDVTMLQDRTVTTVR